MTYEDRLQTLTHEFGQLFLFYSERLPQSREKSLAITNLEQSFMWAKQALINEKDKEEREK